MGVESLRSFQRAPLAQRREGTVGFLRNSFQQKRTACSRAAYGLQRKVTAPELRSRKRLLQKQPLFLNQFACLRPESTTLQRRTAVAKPRNRDDIGQKTSAERDANNRPQSQTGIFSSLEQFSALRVRLFFGEVARKALTQENIHRIYLRLESNPSDRNSCSTTLEGA